MASIKDRKAAERLALRAMGLAATALICAGALILLSGCVRCGAGECPVFPYAHPRK